MSDEGPRHAGEPTAPEGLQGVAALDLDDLLRELLARVHVVVDDQARWRLLLDAVVTMAADLSLDRLLARIVEIAGDLAGARYAALGVLGVGGREPAADLRTHGLSPVEVRRSETCRPDTACSA